MLKRLLLVLLVLAGPLWAVEPSEMLDDPALEERARELSKGLRCLLCRNENIDESNADLAKRLRVLVRERLVAGDSDREVMDFVESRYGEFVLLKPTTRGANIVLWVAGPAMLLLGLLISFVYMRQRASAPASEALSEAEAARLREILDE
ncbi:Cytochrome c heme lyase subunit CcmL [Candidatus Rhodobacter oscarellae]|uniref:Cytochrome c-type biogenesis protein n=1 Tax=Candidatus Rhodobacter oscarellae TaxID=1675527 RepID=A0A0J9E1S5_9RHOB|nr:cytochrome c-type biogenesis protein [Candidatus Rhodobacter lobularis]KMW56632.1 Cytochrome c heme lyase subunit CcmL [Candidatus Rhodobacter lobularis]